MISSNGDDNVESTDDDNCRFYEEGDAASLVIPVNSQFRKNIDWLDDNFPREVKQATLFWKENYFTKHL